MRAQIEEVKNEGDRLRKDIAGSRSDLNRTAEEFGKCRPDYRKWVRIKAVREKYPSLVIASGKTYRDVVVRRVTDAGIEITHSAGPTRVRHDQFPVEWRHRVQWDDHEGAGPLRAHSGAAS